jgi:signal transduction histidine kinase
MQRAVRQAAPGCVLVEFADMNETLDAVARGEVFAAVADVVNASYLIRTQRLTNLRLGSVLAGTSAIRLGVRKDWPELARILNKALASITPLERKQISDRWIAIDYATSDAWLRAFKIAAGAAAAILAVFVLLFLHHRRQARELAERRRIQAELEQAHERLTRISEQKSELLRTVTHDLRNPLTGLTLGIDLLRHAEPGSPDFQSQLDQMRASAQLMMRLINDLVDANVLESGRRNLTWSRVDVAAVLRESAEGLAATAARKGIRLDFTAQEKVMTIQCDLTALRQIADNLISNAVKFSPRDSVIDVAVRWTGTGICLQVRDRGPGISPEARATVFTQYGQGNAKPTGGEKSTGLGLWIVQRVVAALHGRVWCEDAPGGGTIFFVELPRQPADAPVPEAA